ncbi:MAG: hypothetical protein Q9207_002664 [Kuettlingeria erythrocarpa]
MFWSCSRGQRIEVGSARETERRAYEIAEEDSKLRDPQRFLKDRYNRKTGDMHEQWLDLVMAYTRRGMCDSDDRFRAISGLATQYLVPYLHGDRVSGQEYLAGLWRKTMAQELAWSMPDGTPKRPGSISLLHQAPVWSWASVPLESAIVMQHTTHAKPWNEQHFQVLQERAPEHDDALGAAERGAFVKSLKVQGQLCRFIDPRSRLIRWDRFRSRSARGGGQYDTSEFRSETVHGRHRTSGKILMLEPHVKEIVGQLDYAYPDQDDPGPWHFVADEALTDLYCLQVGTSSMLLLERTSYSAADGVFGNGFMGLSAYRRVGVCNDFDEMFFLTRGCLTQIFLV